MVTGRFEMLALIEKGGRFRTSDLYGLGGAGPREANQLTQELKRKKVIATVAYEANTNIWQLVGAPATADGPVAPTVAARAVVGPYDPPPALERANTGLTEALATKLWHVLGNGPENDDLKDSASPMEQRGWRDVAGQVISYLGGLGFTGPGGSPRETTEWNAVFNFDCSNWELVDQDGGGVALVLNGGDVPLLAAAPIMRSAILALLDAVDGTAAADQPQIVALREALPRPHQGGPIMSHDQQSPTDAADFDDDARIRQRDYNRGRNANLAGEVFRDAANLDWQGGWSDAEADRGLEE
jgi:hypothetical protein